MYAGGSIEAGGSNDSLILRDGKSTIHVGAFPPDLNDLKKYYTAVLDLTGSPLTKAERGKRMAFAGASQGTLLYLNTTIGDHPQAPIEQLLGGERDVLSWLQDAWDSGRKILVHCKEGVSRAPTVAAAFLIKHHLRSGGLLLAEEMAGGVPLHTAALRFVRRGRWLINPNEGFLAKLEEFALAHSVIVVD